MEKKYGFKVHTAHIAEVKRSLGLAMYDAPNAVRGIETAEETSAERKGGSDNGGA